MTDHKELIPGMTEIMDHIKKLEKENKELKEQVDKQIQENKTHVKEAEKIEEAIKLVGNQETIYACNEIWYGDEIEEYDSDNEEVEEEVCEECKKSIDGEDKCGEGCPAYDAGWKETH